MPDSTVRTGLDVLVERGFAQLRGLTFGLVTHPAAVDGHLQHAADLLDAAPNCRLAALFGPEHGLLGHAQDLIGVASQAAKDGPQVFSLYGSNYSCLRPTAEQLKGLDALVIDMQDVGSRYYTFQATMLFCLEAASVSKLKVIILDRPNPLGGVAVEGPTIEAGFESFVGIHPITTRHGLTMAELAQLYRAERKISVDLQIIACEGWRRRMTFDQTGLPWVMTSPNMPTPETAFVYPGQCLLEGTNVSEGRGTTRPFEICGAPSIDGRQLARRLNDEGWPGVHFRPVCFQPTFQKHAGQQCRGVQLHILDREAFQPVRTGLAVLAALRDLVGSNFDWRREPYEFVADRLAIDLLFGSPRERQALESGRSAVEIGSAWEADEAAFGRRRNAFEIYS